MQTEQKLDAFKVKFIKQILEETNLEILEDVNKYYLEIKESSSKITVESLEAAAQSLVAAGFASKEFAEETVNSLRKSLKL